MKLTGESIVDGQPIAERYAFAKQHTSEHVGKVLGTASMIGTYTLNPSVG